MGSTASSESNETPPVLVLEYVPAHQTTSLNLECPICLDGPPTISSFVKLPCQHYICVACHSKDQGRCSTCRTTYDEKRLQEWRRDVRNEPFPSVSHIQEIRETQDRPPILTCEPLRNGWKDWDAWEFVDYTLNAIVILVADPGGGARLKDLVLLIPAYTRFRSTCPDPAPPPTLAGAEAVDMLAHWCQRVRTGASLQEAVVSEDCDNAFDAMNSWVAVTDNKGTGHYPKRTHNVLMGWRVDTAAMQRFLEWERQRTGHLSARTSNRTQLSERHILWEASMQCSPLGPKFPRNRRGPLYGGWTFSFACYLISFTIWSHYLVADPGGGARLKDLVALIPAFGRCLESVLETTAPPTLAGAEAVDMLAHWCQKAVTGACPRESFGEEEDREEAGGYDAMKSWIYETDNKETGHYPKRTRNVLMGWKVDATAVEKLLEEERRTILRSRSRAQR
ncbi:hypothetical protein BDZ88DRAFT_435312 [Geranomyces variabilis]|nr:hypothetical protein BDZ88DRAFT_435312 [Geranomyces variabilis]KAJ3134973.1 hypothetical protein HDU90_004298 [Geranomyces variabilis]